LISNFQETIFEALSVTCWSRRQNVTLSFYLGGMSAKLAANENRTHARNNGRGKLTQDGFRVGPLSHHRSVLTLAYKNANLFYPPFTSFLT